jgi:hypothetical protein
LEYEPEELIPIASQLAGACGYLIDHYDRIGDPPKSAEDFKESTEGLRMLFDQLKRILGEDSVDSVPHPAEDYVDLRPRLTKLKMSLEKLALESNTQLKSPP